MRKSSRLKQGTPHSPAAPALVEPRTPHHPKSGTALNELIRTLEADWQLGLRVRDDPISPAQSCAPADKTYGKIQKLFYVARPALDRALDTFGKIATGFKPDQRLELLDGVLKSELCAKSSPTRTETLLDSRSRNELPKSLIYASSSKQRANLTVAQVHTPRSISRLRNTSDDQDKSFDPGSPTDEDTDEEFMTCQSPSPSPLSRSTPRRIQASSFVSLRHSRKRPSESSNDSGNSPKLTKTSKGKQAITSPTQRPIPTPSLFKKPSLNMARSFQAAANGFTSVFISFQAAATSFSSVNTSFSSTSSSSQETNATSANNSFSSYGGASNSDLNRPAESKNKREVDRNFVQGLSRQSNSTFGSIDDDILLDVSHGFEKDGGPLHASVLNTACERNDSRGSPTKAGPPNDFLPRPTSSAASFPLPTEPVPNLATRMVESPSKMVYYIRELPTAGLFVDAPAHELLKYPYFILFICCRLSVSHGIHIQNLMKDLDATSPQSFRSTLRSLDKVSPIESDAVWAAAKKSFEGFTFKGSVVFSKQTTGAQSVFRLDLYPIESERSCLYQRMLGADRFLYLTFPSFSEDKPDRFNKEQMRQIQEQWKLWLMQTHSFLGRRWRVFHLEPVKKKVNTRKEDSSDKRVILFAIDGPGLRPISVGEAINQFIDLVKNRGQNFCKAFARLDLGLSRTIPTWVFKPSEIRRVSDQFSDDTPEACEFNDSSLDWSERSDRQVMNDGCALISVGAALKIWDVYQKITGSNEPLPSTLQGRIGGAKGMWMISSEPHTQDPDHQSIWIQITDSQLKFKPAEADKNDKHYDPHRLTFNYIQHSFVNGSTDLHSLFIPILVDRGVHRDIISDFMVSRLDDDRKQLLDMLQDAAKLHNWVIKQGSATPAQGIITWQAALPLSLPEKVKLLLQSGFTPDQSPYLAKCLKQFIRHRQNWMEQKLRVPLGKATFLLGVADPEHVLRPGEVHIQFSSPFTDSYSNRTYRNLNELEALVARQPACRPSDMQKVRVITHPKLSHLVDVIVFPTQGQFPLAGKLQGGDYDGDTFWICWESELVGPFQNAPAPLRPPNPAKYGIRKDFRTVDDVMSPDDLASIDGLLKEAFDFRTSKSLLGRATNFLEKMAYHENRISSDRIDSLCDVHDFLVDAPKQAYQFNESDFDKLVKFKLRCGNPKVPAYKRAMEICAKVKDIGEIEQEPLKNLKPNPSNILDYLYFEIVRKHNVETYRMLKAALPKEYEDDVALQLPFLQLRDKGGVVVAVEIQNLLVGFEKIVRTWDSNLGDKSDLASDRFDKVLDSCYTAFRSLLPSSVNSSDPEIAPLIYRYPGPDHPTIWETIRASALYTMKSKKYTLVWRIAGRELARLKASSNPDTYNIVPNIVAELKPKPNRIPKPREEEESDDDFETVVGNKTG